MTLANAAFCGFGALIAGLLIGFWLGRDRGQ